MDLKKLSHRAKQMVDKRGGPDALKEDLNELKDIAKGKGSVADKAKQAAEALKHPGPARHGDPATGAPARPAEADVHLSPNDDIEAPDAGLQPDPEAPEGAREPQNPA